MLKVPLPDRIEIWHQYWLLRVPIDQIRSKVGKGTEGGGEAHSWSTVKKVARKFLDLGESEVRALGDPLLLEKWRELMTALDLGESEVRALGYPLLLERWRELKSGEDIGEDNAPDQGGEEPLYEQYEDSPVAQFLPLVRVVARRGLKGGVYGGAPGSTPDRFGEVGELKGNQNDIGMTKQQLEELLASASWRGPLNPDGVEDVSLLPVLGRGEKRQNPPLPLKRHIEFMERIVNA